MEPSQRNGQPQTPHRATTIRPALGSLFAVMLLATGCGVGSDATGTPTAAGTSVFGRAAAGGPFASGGTPKAGKGAVFEAAGGGEVKAYKLLATGLKDPTPSGLLARAPVQALGAFELKIPNSYTGPVLLEVTGNYENPAGNAPGTACATDTFSADKPLISIIPNYVPGTTLTKANISPLTHIAARRAQKLGADAGKLTGSLVRDALRQAAGALSLGALATGDTDSVENSNPIDPGRGSRPGATVGEQQYGLLMAGLDQEACKLKVPLVDLLERMGSDLAADGRLDADASGQSLDLTNRDNQTVVYSLATLTSDLKLAIDEFVDNRQANLSGISLTDLVKTDLTDDLNFPTPPVAGIATLPSNPPAGTVIRLDGTGSIKTRTGGVLAYTWTVTRSGQPVTVTGTTSPNASFTADVQGVYTISLIVNDGRRIGSTSVQLNVGVVTTTTLTVSQPQLSSSTVLAGGTIVATFSVTNTGTIAATQVTPLLTFNRTGSAADGDFSGLSFTPSTTTIAAGLSQTFTAQVTVVPTAQTEHVLVTAQAQATEAPPALSQAAGLDVQAATLQVASFQLTPSSTSPGFGFTAKLEVRNTGAADALGVTPTFGFRTSGGAARVSFGTTSPASVGIPASGLRTFTVPIVVQAQAPLGPLTLTATVHGTNTNTAAASDRTLQIVAVPTATLSAASLTVTPSTTEQGGAALATLTVRNTSANPAYAVAPTFAFSRAGGPPSGLTTGSVNPLTATIQPFTQQVFSAPISVSAVAAAGAYTITAAAAGSNGGTPAATTASLTVLVPAALTLTALNASPTALTTGQSYVATATILNAGGTAAHVTAVSFGVTFTGTVSPSTADISPGLTKTFTLTNATGFASPGSFTLSTVGVTGTDSASGRSLGQAGNTAGSVTFSVQQFPGLTLGTVAVSPSEVTTNQSFVVTVPINSNGPGRATLSGVVLSYTSTSGITATQRLTNPTAVDPTATSNLNFDVTVGPNVPPGTYTAVLALVERSQTGAIQGRSFSNLASAIVTLPAFFREPTHSADIAISVDGTQLWVANPHKNTVTKFGVNGSVLTTIGSPVSVQAEPTFLAISPNGRSVYVTNRASGTVSVIDSASRTVLRTLAVGTEPCGIAVSPNGTRAYVANAMSNSISVLDLSAKPERVMATIALPGREFFPFAVAVTNNVNLRDDDEKVYVTQFYGQLPDSLDTTNTGDTDTGRIGKITVLSSASNTIVQTVTLSPHLTGFTHDRKAFEGGGVSSVITPTFAFPNFLSDVVIKGNYGYVPATGMSPDGPVNFKTNTQSFVYVFDTRTDSEVVTATFNMNAAVDTHNAGTSTNTKVFLNTPWALAFSRTTTAAFVLSAASDVAMRMKLNPADGTPSLTGLSGTPTATTVVQVPANGRNPRGIVFDPTGARAFVHNYIGQNVTVLDAVANTIVRTAGAETAPGTAQAISALHGEELFDTSRQRMSSGGWGSCFSCHAFGWTDSVVWNFGNGPRKATPLNGSFSKSNPAHQRLLNWSAVNDEVEDFEVNIRTVSSNATGQGNNLNPPTGLISNRSTNTLTSTVLSSTTSGLASNWTDIKNYFKFGIRSPISPLRGATVSGSASVTNGRALFGSFGCAACHGGSGWTSSRRFYSPPPPSPTTNLVKAGQVQETLRKVGTFIGTEKTKDNTAAKGADGFNPPSLLGFWAFPPFLHNGRALTVEQVLTRSIAGTNHSTAGGLNRQPTAQEVSDLAAFLKSIDDRTPTFPNIAELRSDAISTGTTLSLSSSKLVIFTLTSDSDSSTAFVTSATLTFNGSTPITATLQSPAPSSIAPVSIAANGSVQFTFSVAAPSDATLASQAGTLTLALTDTYGARTLKRDVGTVTVQNPPVNLTIGSLQLPSTPLTLSRGQTFSVTLPLTNAVANSTTATLLGITIADSSGDVAYVANATLPSVLPANGVPTLIAYTATVGGGAIVGPHTATVTVTYRSVLAAGTQPSVSSNENNAAGYSIQPAPTVTSGPTKLDNRDSGDPDAEVETHSPANITSTFTWAVANATTAATAVVVAVTATASAPTGITVTRTDSITQISGGVTQTFGFTLSADTNASLGTNTLSVTATYLDKNRPSGDTSGGGQVTSDFHFQVVQSPQLTAAPVLPATVGRGETSVPLTLTFSNAAGSASAQVSSITFTFSTQASDVTTQYTATSPDFVQPFVIRAGDVLPLRFLVSVDAAAFTTRTTLTPNVAASDIKTLLPAAVSSTTATFVVTAPRPNLVILSARTNRAVVSANQTLNVTVTVRNTGGADATVNGGQLELLRGGTNVSSNFLVGAAALPALPVTKQGGIADVTFPITPQAAAVGDISADVSVTASGGSPVFMTEATSAAVTRFTVQSPATSGNVFIATAGPPGVDGEPALVSPAAVAVTLSSSAGTADFRVQQLSLSFAIGPDSVASQYRVTAPASLATVPTGGSTLFVFSVSPLDTATRAQPVTVTALAIGADVNTNITSSFSQSFTWVVRDAGGSNPAANATTNTSGTTPFLLFSPFAAVHDGNRLFVSDTDNNRILMFSPINSTVPAACIGQPDFLSRTPNNGTGGVAGGLSAPRGLLLVPPTAAAYSDTLFVADSGNHRVLVYKNVSGQSQFTTSSADLVYGHSLMSDESGPVSPSAMTFSAPASVALTSYLDITSVLRTPPTAIDTTITQHTRVYVADTGNNRVCVLEAKTTSTAVNAQPPPPASPPLPSSGSAAVLAVGQPSLVTSAVVSPPTANSLRSPEGVFVDTSTGRLVVSDSLNARVLVYAENSAIAGSGAGAQVALGEPGLTTDSGGLSISATTLSQPQGVWITTRTLFVADAFTHRVLRFKNFDALASGAPADFVLGQPSFATGTANNASFPPIDPFSLDTPFGVFSVFVPGVGGTHPSFNVIVGDRRNNRVQTYSIPFGP